MFLKNLVKLWTGPKTRAHTNNMGIPDNEALKNKLNGILQNADLESFTKRAARRELEKAFSLNEGDLDVRKQEIADWVEEYINEHDKAADEPTPDDAAADSDEKSGEEQEEATKPAKKAKSGGRGWKPQWLKPALAEFVGAEQMKRTDVVKKIWDHVRSCNLQVRGGSSGPAVIIATSPSRLIF